MSKNLFILGIVLLSSNAFGDWSRNVSRWGTSNWGEGEAYRIAHRAVDITFEELRKQCTQEGGVFRSSKWQGFCDPHSPNDLFGSDTCAVHGKALCYSDWGYLEKEVELSDVGGTESGVFEPGEEVKIEVRVKNPSSAAILDLKVKLSLEGKQALELTSDEVSLGTLLPNETKTASLKGKVPVSASCGAKSLLKFVLTSKDATGGSKFTQQFSQPLGVGKPSKPIIVSLDGVSMPLSKDGISYPIQVAGPDVDIFQVRLSYSAFVQQPANYRAWLTAPNGKDSFAFIPDETRRNVVFNEDLTEFFLGAKIDGKWLLSGDMRRADNVAILSRYQLSITPNIFKCD